MICNIVANVLSTHALFDISNIMAQPKIKV